MAIWIVEPRDPLIFRSGKPFEALPGARANSLPFPYPSTIAGAIRTREGLDDSGAFQTKEIPRVKAIAVQGPFLVELNDSGDIEHWLLPAPGDAVLLKQRSSKEKALLKHLVPVKMLPGAATNLPEDLSLVGFARPAREKPHDGTPLYWYWEHFKDWLLNPEEKTVILNEIGNTGPFFEIPRMHVAINPATRTALEHALFQTQGLEFTDAGRKRLALAVETAANNITPGIAPLGGERRLAEWRKSKKKLPVGPDELFSNIIKDRHCRVILLTPAYFKAGWKPGWLLSPHEDVKVELQAIALQRHQVVSGWDMELRRPKPTRRLAPAGTVLFLKLEGNDDAVGKWAKKMWMSAISDDQQDRLDGFGLAVLGQWDGARQSMEVS